MKNDKAATGKAYLDAARAGASLPSAPTALNAALPTASASPARRNAVTSAPALPRRFCVVVHKRYDGENVDLLRAKVVNKMNEVLGGRLREARPTVQAKGQNIAIYVSSALFQSELALRLNEILEEDVLAEESKHKMRLSISVADVEACSSNEQFKADVAAALDFNPQDLRETSKMITKNNNPTNKKGKLFYAVPEDLLCTVASRRKCKAWSSVTYATSYCNVEDYVKMCYKCFSVNCNHHAGNCPIGRQCAYCHEDHDFRQCPLKNSPEEWNCPRCSGPHSGFETYFCPNVQRAPNDPTLPTTCFDLYASRSQEETSEKSDGDTPMPEASASALANPALAKYPAPVPLPPRGSNTALPAHTAQHNGAGAGV